MKKFVMGKFLVKPLLAFKQVFKSPLILKGHRHYAPTKRGNGSYSPLERGLGVCKKRCELFKACLSIIIYMAFFISISANSQTLSGQEIIKQVDKNHVYEKIEYIGKMTIKKDKKIITKTMHAFAEGDKKTFTEFTNPEDRGTKYLKLANELWIYFPDAEEPVKISGHMLKESMMGSDFSYEDALENEELIKRYSVNVIGSEVINKSDCYILELNAKDKKITYAKRKLWVDKEKFVVVKTQLFALSGRLLKESIAENIQKYGDRYFATKLTMMNKLLKNSATIFEMTDINFNAKIPDGIFSKRSLEK